MTNSMEKIRQHDIHQNRQHVVWNSSDFGGQKNRVLVFLPKNLFSTNFDPKHQGNTLETLSNQSMTSKNTNNCSKLKINPKPKNISSIYLFFLRFQGKKILNLNPFFYHKEPSNTKIFFLFVAEIIANNNFLSLYWNSASSFFFF